MLMTTNDILSWLQSICTVDTYLSIHLYVCLFKHFLNYSIFKLETNHRNNLVQRLANHNPWDKWGPKPVSIKFYWNSATPNGLYVGYSCFLHVTEVSSCDRAKNIYYLTQVFHAFPSGEKLRPGKKWPVTVPASVVSPCGHAQYEGLGHLLLPSSNEGTRTATQG